MFHTAFTRSSAFTKRALLAGAAAAAVLGSASACVAGVATSAALATAMRASVNEVSAGLGRVSVSAV